MFCFCCFFFSFLFDVLRDITNWFLFKTEPSPVLHFLDHLVTLTRDVYTYIRPCPDRTYTCHIVTMTYLAIYANKLIPQSILSLNDYIILLLKFQLTWWCLHCSNLVEDAVGYCQLRLWGWGNCEFWTQGGVRFSAVSNRHTRNNFVSRQGR